MNNVNDDLYEYYHYGSIDKIQDFYLNLARGRVPEVSSDFKFGRSSLVTSTESVIWVG